MLDRKEFLIQILIASDATEAEQDDAAIDLGDFDEEDVRDILAKVANDPAYSEMVRGSCGESLANIWIRTSEIDFEVLLRMQGIALQEMLPLIKKERTDWYERYMILRK